MESSIRTESLESLQLRDMANYCDDRIAVIDNLHNLGMKGQSIKAGAYAACLCTQGRGSLYIDGTLHEIKVNDLFICHPNIIVEHYMSSLDCETRILIMSPEYIQQLSIIGGSTWDIKLFLDRSPIISLNETEVSIFCQYYDLLKSKLASPPSKHHTELINALLQAFLYEFHDSLERFHISTTISYSCGENLFKEFLELLSSSYPKPRMVSAYVERLFVTPKYLSTVCKNTCGHTASELINQYVLKDIQYLLKRPEKSIKDIAYELDFPNLSFFGKYVKNHLGVSPRQYREQKNG